MKAIKEMATKQSRAGASAALGISLAFLLRRNFLSPAYWSAVASWTALDLTSDCSHLRKIAGVIGE